MRTVDCVQGSPEWHQARCGKVTASRISDLMATTKSGYGASRGNYMAELVAERLTGASSEGYTNAAMQWGKDHEAEARAAYEFYRDATVAEVGFVLHPTIDLTGCSPDGLVGEGGMVEIKCPNTGTHVDTLLGAGIPDKYIKQMQWQMRCCERKWCDFVSYDPRLPARMQLSVQRVNFDLAGSGTIEKAVIEFLADVASKEKALIDKFGSG